MESDISRFRDYSSLFSRQHGLSWLKGDYNSIIDRVKLYDMDLENLENYTYLDYLKYIYRIIERKYANEYVVKNSFINYYLFDEFKSTNSVIFNEFRVGKSIGDIAVFNGVSKVFEIKSEFDSPKRLASQITDYKTLFNEIYLIIPYAKRAQYLDIDDSVGIITFDFTKSRQFNVYRSSEKKKSADPIEMMNILRTNEYKNIVKSYFGSMPKMSSFNQFDICKSLICKIPQDRLNEIFLSTIKMRIRNSFLANNNHKELNQLNLAMKLNKSQHCSIVNNLKNNIKI